MSYNLTNMTDGMSPVNLLSGLNVESGGLFGVMLLVTSMIVIMFISYYRLLDLQTSIIIGTFAGIIIGLLSWTLGILKLEIVLIPVGILVITILLSKLMS